MFIVSLLANNPLPLQDIDNGKNVVLHLSYRPAALSDLLDGTQDKVGKQC